MTQTPATPLPPPKERRRLREARSLSQAQVAAEIGVSRKTVRAWETGRTTPRGRQREAYARLLIISETSGTASPPRAGSAGKAAGRAVREIVVRTESGAGTAPARTSGKPRPGEGTERTGRARRPGRSWGAGGGAAGTGAAAAAADTADGVNKAGGTGADDAAGTKSVADGGACTTHAAGPAGPAGSVDAADAAVSARPAGGADGTSEAGEKSKKGEKVEKGGRAEKGEADGANDADKAAEAELTPDQAFDALYAFCAPALVRQAYLLTGRRELAREAVERAFHLAWQRWPEVAVDRDPAGWVRAVAHEYALSPWHRLRPRHRTPEQPPAALDDRRLLTALLSLPPAYRRTLLLYDGIGLDLPETAAETEASTPAAAGRVEYARDAVASRVPGLEDPEALRRRMTGLAGTERLRPVPRPVAVRAGSERRARHWTRAAIAFTALIVGATVFTLHRAPDHYEAPQAPAASVRGVPPRSGPGPLSPADLTLRAELRSAVTNGPYRLVPETR
ncbi:helix-turn-helix domain-containing protein [Streptomyces minutiscleroticus]|uniref:helix-turn-helix domain-containing protein n=1 Tax=Streptomyces minutiscleroticus TaxID=68238 RepID=UPI00332020D1